MFVKVNQTPKVTRILPGQLTPSLEDLYLEYVNELYEDPDLPNIIDLIKMFKLCPINRIAVELKSLRAVSALGLYSHPDKSQIITKTGRKTLTEWVNSNFVTMRGNIYDVLLKMFKQAIGFGYSVGEINYSANVLSHQGEWRLNQLRVLNPCTYNFAGIYGDWDRIIYRSRYSSHFPVPRKKLLHIYTPSMEEPENPLGDAQGNRGYVYYQARKLSFMNWSNQLAKGVKGQTVVSGDSNATVPKTNIFGEIERRDGKIVTVSAVQEAAKAFSRAKDGDAVGVDASTKVQHFPGISGTGQDYNLAITRYTDDIFMSYGIPKTILQEGSGALGQSGLNSGHRIILDAQIEAMVMIARDIIVEQVIQDLLAANFGIHKDDEYGSFNPSTYLPPEMAGTRISNIMSAMLQGIIPANDLEAVNRIRLDCGLSAYTSDEFQELQIQQIQELQRQQESYAAQAA